MHTRPTINAGECVNLRWDVEQVREVYLDGQGVTGHESRQVCPSSTTTYTLRIVTDVGAINKTITVNVAVQPVPLPPPQVVFYPDKRSVLLGECVVLHWAVANVQRFSLDGKPLRDNPGEQKDCLRADTTYTTYKTYTLSAETANGTVSQQARVFVLQLTNKYIDCQCTYWAKDKWDADNPNRKFPWIPGSEGNASNWAKWIKEHQKELQNLGHKFTVDETPTVGAIVVFQQNQYLYNEKNDYEQFSLDDPAGHVAYVEEVVSYLPLGYFIRLSEGHVGGSGKCHSREDHWAWIPMDRTQIDKPDDIQFIH